MNILVQHATHNGAVDRYIPQSTSNDAYSFPPQIHGMTILPDRHTPQTTSLTCMALKTRGDVYLSGMLEGRADIPNMSRDDRRWNLTVIAKSVSYMGVQFQVQK